MKLSQEELKKIETQFKKMQQIQTGNHLLLYFRGHGAEQGFMIQYDLTAALQHCSDEMLMKIMDELRLELSRRGAKGR